MLINMIGFNVAWFGLILLGNTFIPVAVFMLLAHFTWFSIHKWERKFVALVALIGISVDSLLQFSNVFIFDQQQFIPAWLMMIWVCFAATICHSLAFLSAYKPLQLLLGFFIAPLSYRSGEMFGAVQFGESYLTTHLLLGSIWACLLLLFFAIKSRFTNREVRYA